MDFYGFLSIFLIFSSIFPDSVFFLNLSNLLEGAAVFFLGHMFCRLHILADLLFYGASQACSQVAACCKQLGRFIIM